MNALAVLRRFLFGAPLLRHDMVRVARRAPQLLGESAELIRCFLLQKQNPDGGFQDRAGRSDLYYTVFGLQALLVLQTPLPVESVSQQILSYEGGDGLDFVHLCCLARCRAILGDAGVKYRGKANINRAIARRIEAHRAQDGGYYPTLEQPHGTAYAAFLALGAYQDLQMVIPQRSSLADSLRQLACADGAWANECPAKIGGTNSTAAAMAVLGSLGCRANYRTAGKWMLDQAHPLGGFRASPLAPLPDLLSTATALHSIASLGRTLEPVREQCLDFIDSLWSNEGGFHGHWNDDLLDVEYTFYGLLALGHLAKPKDGF